MDAVIVGNLPHTRQTWRDKPIRELFAECVAEQPDATETALRRRFHQLAKEDEDYLSAIIDYAFDASWRAYDRQTVRDAERAPITAAKRAEAAQRRAGELREHAARVEHIKEQIILLNQEMPNGKRARFCTLDYMYRLGGAYRKIGKAGSQKLVGAVYDETGYRKKLAGLV